jgi:plasmid maintenance system antidote protein VapI
VLTRRGISADTAFRLARYFGTTPHFWINLQGRYDWTRRSENFAGASSGKFARAPPEASPFSDGEDRFI